MVQVHLPLPIRPGGQAVKTPPFHGGNTGSIPVRVTTRNQMQFASGFFCKKACPTAGLFLLEGTDAQLTYPLHGAVVAEKHKILVYFRIIIISFHANDIM